jgi:hypothetical protein
MQLDFLNVPEAPPPPPTAAYSHAVRSGDWLFVTGQLGVDPKTGKLVPGGTIAQCRRIMQNRAGGHGVTALAVGGAVEIDLIVRLA